jgi:hypothetical protein
LLNTISFTTYANTRALVGLPPAQQGEGGKPWRVAAAGALVCIPVTLVSTPAELLKLQQQTQPQYRHGTLHALRSVAAQHGARSLFTGMGVNCLREAVFLSTYFCVYEQLRDALPGVGLPNSLAVASAGGISGALAWTLSFPLDTLKTAVQGASMSAPRTPALQLLRRLVVERGVAGLYAGVLPSVLRAFLVSSTRFSAYELAIEALS